MNLIWFDLEGPLAPQHSVYELMKPFPRAGKTFKAITRGDDLQIFVAQCFQFLSRDINIGG
jgi:predicted HAD superfamily phosphohydrolase